MRVLIFFVLLGFCILARGQEIIAYHAYWMGDVWRQYDLGKFRRILFFDLAVDPSGRLTQKNGWPEKWMDLRQQALVRGVPVDPVVTVLGREVFSAVFGSADARALFLSECVALARESGGLHLDVEVFEPVEAAHLEAFRIFLADLRRSLDTPPRRFLSAFIPSAGDLYSPKELAYLDEVVAQGYDVHWAEAPTAGPVALLRGESAAAWETAAGKLLRGGVAPEKLFFSTPLYGYEWPVVSDEPRAASRGPARIVTYAPVGADLLPDIRLNALTRVAVHGLRREPGSETPWYVLRDSDGWWQGWYDDAISLRKRLVFVREGGFGGVAFFVLGYDGGALLEVARDVLKVPARRASDARPATGR